MDTVKAQTSKPLWPGRRWRTSGIVLALMAALFEAFVLISDTNVMTNVITHEQGIVAVLVYLTMGSWIGVTLNYVYNRLFGPTIDPTFTGEKWIGGTQGLWVAVAGITGALGTFAYLFVAGKGDPSILIALSNVSLIYLALYDAKDYRGKSVVLVVIAAAMVLIGAGLASVNNLGAGLTITVMDLVLLVVFRGGFKAIGSIAIFKVRETENMVNVAFWRFVWLAITGTVLTLLVAGYLGVLDEYFALMTGVWWKAFPWVMLTMFLAYGGNTLAIVAQKYERASTVSMITNANNVMAVPVTLVAAWALPGMFDLPEGAVIWLLRLIGSALIVLGIFMVPKEKHD
ncbi:hypothetical protein A2619_02915 [candidate division WWE3 bacterium RIFOXYD1_FULL_39_9]|nr:MAG: hypothetical protein A2619_02915 [candidate division WWE3 bacterium RIFOXYD1_FULL_39_9]